MPPTAEIVKIIFSALFTFALGFISKQLHEIKENRKAHETAMTSLNSKIGQIEERLDELSRRDKTAEMRSSRYRIIRFDDEEQHGMRHSDDHWDQILEDVDIYCRFCKAPENKWFQNHKGQAAMNRIVIADQNGRNREEF